MAAPVSKDVAEATAESIFTTLPAPLVQSVLGSAPFVPISGAYNLRDVGLCGADINSETVVKPGLLYRSAALNDITPEGIQALTQRGVVKVVDLRSDQERQRLPTPPMEGIDNVWLPPARQPAKMDLAGLAGSQEHIQQTFAGMYDDILVTHIPIYRYVFEHIRDAPAGESLLFHCQGGKDRTGVLAALILNAAGVPADIIAHDYSLTRIGLEPARQFLLKATARVPSPRTGAPLRQQKPSDSNEASASDTADAAPRSADLVAAVQQAVQSDGSQDEKKGVLAGICRSDYTTMEAFLRRLQDSYGGAEGYLTSHLGFSPDDVAAIRTKLLI